MNWHIAFLIAVWSVLFVTFAIFWRWSKLRYDTKALRAEAKAARADHARFSAAFAHWHLGRLAHD